LKLRTPLFSSVPRTIPLAVVTCNAEAAAGWAKTIVGPETPASAGSSQQSSRLKGKEIFIFEYTKSPRGEKPLALREANIDLILISQLEMPSIHIHSISILLRRIPVPPAAKDRIPLDHRTPAVIALGRNTVGLGRSQIIDIHGRSPVAPPKHQFILLPGETKTTGTGELDGRIDPPKRDRTHQLPIEIININARQILHGDLPAVRAPGRGKITLQRILGIGNLQRMHIVLVDTLDAPLITDHRIVDEIISIRRPHGSITVMARRIHQLHPPRLQIENTYPPDMIRGAHIGIGDPGAIGGQAGIRAVDIDVHGIMAIVAYIQPMAIDITIIVAFFLRGLTAAESQR